MSGIPAYPLYGLRRLPAPKALGASSVTQGVPGYCRKLTLYTVTKLRRLLQIRSQCSKNSADAPRDTVPGYTGTTGVSGLAGRRYRFVHMARLVRGCCEWYWIVLRGEW
eukprot:2005952-Rhodomonas_salina.1